MRPPKYKVCRDRLSRFTLDANGVPGAETVILEPYAVSVWHNGGGLFFHPENGHLYITNRDDTTTNTQKINGVLFSGVLRIDVDKRLSSAPVAIKGVSRNAGTDLITINLNGTPSAKEKVYVRYTDSAWKYSQVIQATVAGNSATATIPDIKDGKNYAWYVFTSTATPDKFHNGFATDALTLSWNNNAG